MTESDWERELQEAREKAQRDLISFELAAFERGVMLGKIHYYQEQLNQTLADDGHSLQSAPALRIMTRSTARPVYSPS